MDFSKVKSLTIPEGVVKKIEDGNGNTIWKGSVVIDVSGSHISVSGNGEYDNGASYTITITADSGYYISSFSDMGSSYGVAESIIIDGQSYPRVLTYYGTATDNKTYSVVTTNYYTTTVVAGDYISSLKIKTANSSYTSSSSSVSIYHNANATIYWDLVSYDTTNAQYTYSGATSGSFNGGTGGSVTISTRSRTLNSYTITFVNYDNTVLQSSSVYYGDTPSYNGATPTKTSTNYYYYTFSGWSPSISSVTGNQVYTAQFNEMTRTYTTTVIADTTRGVNTVRAGTSSYSNPYASVNVSHTYNQNVNWEMVNYKSGTIAEGWYYNTYSGSTSGTITGTRTGTTYYVQRSVSSTNRTPSASDFYFVMNNDYDSDSGETSMDVKITNNFGATVTMQVDIYDQNQRYLLLSCSSQQVSAGQKYSYYEWVDTGTDGYYAKVSWSGNGRSGNFWKSPNEFSGG